MLIYSLILTIILQTTLTTSKKLPAYIEKCSISDPNLGQCLNDKAAAASRALKEGNKELGIAPLEPFVITKVDLGNRTTGSTYLHQTYHNMKMFGLTNVTFGESIASFVDGNCFWNYTANVPFVRMESQYEVKGQILLFPINGHGNCVNSIYDINGRFSFQCERYNKKNRTYLRVTRFGFNVKPAKIVVDFENLIDGNEQLSAEVNKTLNENSDALFEEVGAGFNDVLGNVWKVTLNQVFSRVPVDELFLP